MRAIYDQQATTLFGGERIAIGYRGRRSGSNPTQQASRCLSTLFGVLLIGCASAATAYTVHQSAMPARNIIAGANLSVPAGSLQLASTVW
jgi:hypothetical protein